MRVLIATAATMALAAAAAAGVALHSPASRAQHPGHASDAVAPTDAVPGLVWHSGSATLRLMDGPCTSEELRSKLDTEGIAQPRAYEVTQGSKRYTGCWTKDVGGDVVTAEPGRDVGSIPIGWFHAGG